jgi:SWI/SNF-related matrix-associated actin-dependent regulator 1 of chromatin subfamily A
VTLKKKKTKVVQVLSSDNEEEERKPPPRNRKTNSDKPRKGGNVDTSISSSSEDDDLLNPSATTTGKKSNNPKAAASIETEKATISKFFQRTDEKEEEPTPIVARRARTKARVFEEDDDDEDEPPASRQLDKEEAAAPSDSDEDEQMGLALALSESLQDSPAEAKPQEPNRFAEYSASSHSELVDLVDSDEDDKDEPDDEGDNYDSEDDRDAKEAGVILKTAKRLSKQVMATLQSWSPSAAQGMIIDGAIARTVSEPDQTSWIPAATMQEICPELKLKDYQLIAVNWLALLHGLTAEVNGKQTNINGILADDMGLGKTCQTIAFLAWLKHHQQEKQGSIARNPIHLIVVPPSVVSNWENEIHKFAPHLNVVKYYGNETEREETQHDLRRFLSQNPTRDGEALDIILTPFSYFEKEKSADRSFLRKFQYDYLVVDEGHKLKNWQGNAYKNLDRFRTKHRLLLTGTPVMNSPQELMSLLCFLMPLFSRKSHVADDETTNDGGSRMLQHFVSLDNKGEDTTTAYHKLKELFAPFVLRRRKVDVLSDMAPKSREVEFVELGPVARGIYDGILERHVKKKGPSNINVFTQLRKAAQNPLLLRTRYLEKSENDHLVTCFQKWYFKGSPREKVEKELDKHQKYHDFAIHQMAHGLLEEHPECRADVGRYILQEEDLFAAPKCARLRSLLPDLVAQGHRILIFSVWTSCLDLLSCLLEVLDMKYLRMDGSTDVRERQPLIDQFTRDTSVPIFLLSTRACGLGITLTAADTCIMHDIDFNPFSDLQAEDRCHRIGQEKPVTVYKLVSRDTVDQYIYQMQERKAKMSAAIMESAATEDFDEKKERQAVIQTAVNHYLRSPESRKTSSEEKENGRNVLMVDSL